MIPYSRRNAFTLVELLVVIAIIAVLIAVLLPSLNRARMQALKIACASNMRQVALALVNYSNDYRGYMPPNGGYLIDLGPSLALDYPPAVGRPLLDLRGLGKYLGNTKIMMCPGLFAQASLINGEQLTFWWDWYDKPASVWTNAGPLISSRIGYTFMWSTPNVCNEQNYGPSPPPAAPTGKLWGQFSLRWGRPVSFYNLQFNDWWILTDRAVYDPSQSGLGVNSAYKNWANALRAQFPHDSRQGTGGNAMWGDGHVSWVNDPWLVWYNSFLYMDRRLYQ